MEDGRFREDYYKMESESGIEIPAYARDIGSYDEPDVEILTEKEWLSLKVKPPRIAEIKKPMVRLSLDSWGSVKSWESAFEKLRVAGLPKRAIRSYALIGFDSGPAEAWERCQWIESHGIKVLPMWFHPLNAMERNKITEDQQDLRWTDLERKRIMQWYYQHNEKYGKSKYRRES